MIVYTQEFVINTTFGGFNLPREIADWLIENKGWSVVDDINDELAPDCKLVVRCFDGNYYPAGDRDDPRLRSNPDLIEAVRAVQKKFLDDNPDAGRNKKRDSRLFDLSVVTVAVDINIVNYHDGREQVDVNSFVKETC
jgi:hypothetical protein